MVKKKKIIIIISSVVILGAIILVFSYMKENRNSKIVNKDNKIVQNKLMYPKEIKITALPSPPRQRIVKNSEDIKKIVDFINNMKLGKKATENYKGWAYKIDISGANNYSITLSGDKVTTNNGQYYADSLYLEKFNMIYKELK